MVKFFQSAPPKLNSDKTVALIDVDNTILFEDGKASLNEVLLDEMYQAGIRDVYLFTSMDMRDILDKLTTPDFKSRDDIVARLKDIGFNVLGVIIPGDPATGGLGLAYLSAMQPFYDKINRNELQVDENDRMMGGENIHEFNTSQMYLENLSTKSNQMIQDQFGIRATDNVKIGLFLHLLKHLDSKYNSCLVVDDSQKVLAHLASFLETAKQNNFIDPNFNFSTLWIPSQSLAHTTGKEIATNTLQNLSKLSSLKEGIEQHINNLQNSGKNDEVTKQKIDFLIKLEHELNTYKTVSTKELEKNINELVNDPKLSLALKGVMFKNTKILFQEAKGLIDVEKKTDQLTATCSRSLTHNKQFSSR